VNTTATYGGSGVDAKGWWTSAMLPRARCLTRQRTGRKVDTVSPADDDVTAAPDEQSTTRAAREQALTDQVVASLGGAGDPRFREVMTSLVGHLHGFVRDVRLTEPEWEAAIAFLTRTGRTCDDKRQEFVLLSDVLGVSMLTVTVNEAPPGVTESTVFGPFFVDDAPFVPLGGDLARGASGTPCWVSGAVRSADGTPLAGARLDVWEADDDGFYDVQLAADVVQGRGYVIADDEGGFRFWSVRPAAYPIPVDGPVGDLLAAAGRGPMRPAHIHFRITAPGHRTLTTHVFASGDRWLDDDAVFGVKASLVADFVDHPTGEAPPGAPGGPWASMSYDFVLAPEGTTR
jgi:hydroxyquinol 1,2-dioxygenase